MLGKIFEEEPRKIKLEKVMSTYQTYSLKDTENGFTLENLFVGMNQEFNLTIRQREQTRSLNMLFSDETFTPEAEWMLDEFFTLYSTEGLMSKDQACEYIYASTKTKVKPTEHWVTSFFAEYDSN